LVKGIPFMMAHVDATSAGVNLSAKSIKCWPMSAISMMNGLVNRSARDRKVAETGGAPAYDATRFTGFKELLVKLIAEVPTLKAINDGWQAMEQGQKEREEVQTAADLR